jgi:hypothetical protein
VPHKCKLDFSNLGWQPRSLLHLDEPVTENELQSVIMEAPKEKAPGPNGFIGLFFSSCWDIINERSASSYKPIFGHESTKPPSTEPTLYSSYPQEGMP